MKLDTIPLATVTAAIFLAASGFAECAAAQTTAAAKRHWSHLPNSDDMARTFPAAAVNHGVHTGKAIMKCEFTQTGHLTSCSIVSESPEGLGFGAAALKLADRFRLGDPVAQGTEIDIPITWYASY